LWGGGDDVLFTHWFHFFFWGGAQPSPSPVWYERAVWGNVVAVLPLAVLGLIGFLWHRGVVKELHAKIDREADARAEHTQHLKKIMDALDPETGGGIADVLDRLEPSTPSGIGVLAGKLDALAAEGVGESPAVHTELPIEEGKDATP
jgi:hypothetical protein